MIVMTPLMGTSNCSMAFKKNRNWGPSFENRFQGLLSPQTYPDHFLVLYLALKQFFSCGNQASFEQITWCPYRLETRHTAFFTDSGKKIILKQIMTQFFWQKKAGNSNMHWFHPFSARKVYQGWNIVYELGSQWSQALNHCSPSFLCCSWEQYLVLWGHLFTQFIYNKNFWCFF